MEATDRKKVSVSQIPEKYASVTVNCLSMSTKRRLAEFLDEDAPIVVVLEGPCVGADVVSNYSGLGELLKVDYQELYAISVSYQRILCGQSKYLPHYRLPLFSFVRTFTIIAQYWLVPAELLVSQIELDKWVLAKVEHVVQHM